MGLKIYNTLSGKKELFVPLTAGEVRIYVCGITAYDQCHVGHARALFTFDVVCRYLRFLGYRVLFVRNITDLDDKIIQKAQAEESFADVIANRYVEAFHRDTSALGLLAPDYEPKATDYIPEMIDLIQLLEEKGLAYQVDGDVFYSVDAFPAYGRLSRRKLDELQAGARVEVDERKRHPMDFALWKQRKAGEPYWKSPWGTGRPGWHIECSVMSTKYLGQPFDIHGGGRDLIFPHHENEIAQSEGAFELPLARYWMHNGFVNVNHEKMSKSLGNICMISEILERFDSFTLRHYMLATHYRSPLDFSEAGVAEIERAVVRVHEALERLESLACAGKVGELEEGLLEEFRSEMDEDFNTPRAIGLIFEELRKLNRLMDDGKGAEAAPRWKALRTVGEVLGLWPENLGVITEGRRTRWLGEKRLLAADIEGLIHEREEARKRKEWDEADRIRSQLKEKGVVLEDTPAGTVWKVR